MSKIAAKVGAKAGGKVLPGVGQVIMFVEGAPIAIEELGNLTRAEKRAARKARKLWSEGKRAQAAKYLVRYGLVDRTQIMGKGIARTALAAFIAKEMSEAIPQRQLAKGNPDRYTRVLRKQIQAAAKRLRDEHGRTKGYEEAIRVGNQYDRGSIGRGFWYEVADTVKGVNVKTNPDGRYIVYDLDDTDWTMILDADSGAEALVEARRRAGKRKGHYQVSLVQVDDVVRNNPAPQDAGLFQDVLAHLRALQWIYWNTHWTAAGPNFYGTHLLLQRLYEGDGDPDIQEEIDQLGERMVAYFGVQSVNPSVIEGQTQVLVDKAARANNPVEALLLLEDSLQDSIKRAWSANQKSNMSLGLDDYLMGLANERDTARYLLKRTLTS